MGKLVMRVAHVAPIRARCFNSKRTSFHVALELEHVESVDLRSAIRKADAVLPAFAREGQRGHTVKRVARRGRCRLLFLLGVQHIFTGSCAAACLHILKPYSKGLSHRNRLGGGSQSISKFSWEIEPTVSQFLNVHGKFSESRVSIGLLLVCLCAVRSIN